MKHPVLFCTLVALPLAACATEEPEGYGQVEASLGWFQGELPFPNAHGISSSYSSLGPIDEANPFFVAMGTNGRSCVPCHDPRAGWTISSDLAQLLFATSDGLDPLFRIHDVGTRPDAPLATRNDRKKAFAPMTEHGLVRFATTIPDTAELEVIAVDDPYGYGTPQAFTRFRRPTTTSSESQVSSLTWTGGPQDDIFGALATLFQTATTFHGQGTRVIPDDVREQAASFMFDVYNAQELDWLAGRLDADGARGGPVHLAQQELWPGINSGASFDRNVFDIYDAWESSPNPFRRRIARGQRVFNTKEFRGANGTTLTCSSCHNAPNVGSSSTFRMMDVGTVEVTNKTRKYLPVLTIRNKTTHEVRRVTDLGRAVVTGLWDDVGRFKVPQIRGLASRAPYFHDGRAETISDIVGHYEDHFGIRFKGTERQDLIAFLAAL